ncbi:MAG: hypothetical protein L0229_20395 [Blastocatellia bacterium]|nr:hypothetical protein [Blastocatellia bacterium]
MELIDVLSAIGSTEPSSFSEFCRGLEDCPEPGDRAVWRELLGFIGRGEREGLIEVERTKGMIDTLILTEAGAALVRNRLDSKRGLLARMYDSD